jgi:hypothetical protein
MNPIPLVRLGTTEVAAHACGACGRAYGVETHLASDAARCCLCYTCERPLADEPHHGGEHASCASARHAKMRADDLAQHAAVARVLTHRRGEGPVALVPEAAYSGPVCWAEQGPEDGYFASVDDLCAWCADHGEPVPAWVWACDVRPFAVDAEGVVESATDDLHESVRESIGDGDVAALQKLLDGWVAAVGAPETWDADHTRAVVLAPAVAAAVAAVGEAVGGAAGAQAPTPLDLDMHHRALARLGYERVADVVAPATFRHTRDRDGFGDLVVVDLPATPDAPHAAEDVATFLDCMEQLHGPEAYASACAAVRAASVAADDIARAESAHA